MFTFDPCMFLAIAFQAAQRVLSTPVSNALGVLRDISQNFPIVASSLVKTQVKEEVKKEITENQKVNNQLEIAVKCNIIRQISVQIGKQIKTAWLSAGNN